MNKALNFTIIGILLISFNSCKKEQVAPSTEGSITYSSMQDFYKKNGVKKETFTLDAITGGSFVSVKGTTVSIPANAFKDSIGNFIIGPVNFEFKDIYKKSDMILSDMPTNCPSGAMKSAGEFYLTAFQNNLQFHSVKDIKISQPSKEPFDNNMGPYVIFPGMYPTITWDYFGGAFSSHASVTYTAPNYLYTIYSGHFFSSNNSFPITWYNTDNSTFFSTYPQTTLTIVNPDSTIQPDVFLIFKSVNAAIQVFNAGGYYYNYAPIGMQVSVVAGGIKDGKLHASIIPITISANQTVTLNLKPMSTTDFETALIALD